MNQASAQPGNDRITRILSHPEAHGREMLAKQLAINSTMSVEEAVVVLRAAGRERGAAPAQSSAAQIYEFRRQCVANARQSRVA